MSNGNDKQLKTDQFMDSIKDMAECAEKQDTPNAFKYLSYALKHLYSAVGDNITMSNIKQVHSKLHYGSRMSVIKDIGIIAGVVFTLLKIYRVL